MDPTERGGDGMNPFAMAGSQCEPFAWIINEQIILATELTLLLIWWVEVRNGRVW